MSSDSATLLGAKERCRGSMRERGPSLIFASIFTLFFFLLLLLLIHTSVKKKRESFLSLFFASLPLSRELLGFFSFFPLSPPPHLPSRKLTTSFSSRCHYCQHQAFFPSLFSLFPLFHLPPPSRERERERERD